MRRIPIQNLGRSPMMGQAAQKKLVACINGPDLYDVYNSDMTLVAKGVLNPNASYPDAQIDFAKFPPCPVPMATGAGGLCDVPNEYLAPKDPSGTPGKPVLVCYTSQGVTLLDYVTGAPIGTHLNASCLSLLSSFTAAQEGDPRCSGGSVPATPTPTSTQPTSTTSSSPGGSQGTSQPSPGDQGQGTSSVSPGGEVMPTSGSAPIPAAGQNGVVPVLPQTQKTTVASAPTGAFPGQPFAAARPAQAPVPIAKAPAPLPPPCPLGPVPLRKWVEGCMG